MLLDLRETVRSSKPIKYTLITLICIPFVLFGIGSYFSGGSAPSVATVNGEEITQPQLDAATQRQRQQLAQLFGGQLPEAFADETALRGQALEQIVTQRVLEETVADQRFAVGDATLGRAIRELPAFQVDGQFDRQTYDLQVRSSGLSVPDFEQSFRDDTALNQFRLGVVDTSFTLPGEAARMNALASQTRTIDAVRFDLDAAKSSVEPSDEAVAAWFEENAASYVFPERVKIEWIELDAATIAAGIDVTDEEAQARYEENRSSYVRPEQREASHILLALDLDADEDEVAEKQAVLDSASERIADGETFATLAAELSEDVGTADSGGSLGVISSDMGMPEFEAAVFALAAEGDVSEPVRTSFGLHLVRLDKIVPEAGKPFDEVREEILENMRSSQAEREFFDLRSELTELVFDESTSLEPAADATGLEVQGSDWLDVDTVADAGPLLSNPAILPAALDPEVREAGNNSELIEVGPRHVVALRVTESEEPRPKTLDDVRDQVIDEIKAEQAGTRLDELAAAALESLETPDVDVAALVADEPLAEALAGETLERQSTVLDGNVVAAIFALPRPTEDTPLTATATLEDGDRVAYALRSVDEPPVAEAASEVDPSAPGGGVLAGADPRLGNVEFEALLGSLRERADVELRN